MNGTLRIGTAALALACAGCVGYGFPGAGGGGGGYGPGSGGYGRPVQGGPGYGQGGIVRCESRDRRRNYCAADTRGGVHLSRQLSSDSCVQGSTWGYDARGVWVTNGCRADFALGRSAQRPGRPGGPGYGAPGPGRPGHGGGQIVRCESQNNRHRRCNATVQREVRLVRQLSRTRCVQRQNWGWDRGGIWVDGGCRAEFEIR